jgi:hypothetical protein
MAQYLVNCARSLIFSTAPPPPAVAGALAALDLLEANPQRVDRLIANADALRDEFRSEGVPVPDCDTQIVPIVIGDPGTTMALCEAVLERGVFAQAIRPPTVPEGTSRLRLAVMASHRAEELREAARIIARTARRLGARPAVEQHVEEPIAARDTRPEPGRERRRREPEPAFEAYDEFEAEPAGIFDGQADAYPGGDWQVFDAETQDQEDPELPDWVARAA